MEERFNGNQDLSMCKCYIYVYKYYILFMYVQFSYFLLSFT